MRHGMHIYAVYASRVNVFAKKTFAKLFVRVSVCVFFFPFPSQLHIHSGDFGGGEKKTEKLTFFHPAIFHSRI